MAKIMYEKEKYTNLMTDTNFFAAFRKQTKKTYVSIR